MAERKVFNKYIPPDFDPLLLPKGERPPNNQIKLRNMLPMTICCNTCGEYMGRGTKFNSRQEIAQGMDWKGIKRWRFYIKCSSCSSEMTFLTDPEHDHYVPEHGCSSMTEPWRAKIEAEEAYIRSRENEEQGDDMKALENRSKETKYQLDLMDTITDLQEINKRNTFMNVEKVIQVMHNTGKNNNNGDGNDLIGSKELETQLNAYRLHRSKRRKLNSAVNNIDAKLNTTTTTTTIVDTPLLSTPMVQFQFGGNSHRDKTTTTEVVQQQPQRQSNLNMNPNPHTNSIASITPVVNLHQGVIVKKRKKPKKIIQSDNADSKKKTTTTTATTKSIEKPEEKEKEKKNANEKTHQTSTQTT